MILTVIGVILGSIVSWLLTHIYYRKTEQATMANNPMQLLESMQKDIEVVRKAIEDPNNLTHAYDTNVQEAMDRIHKILPMLMHSLGVKLQKMVFLIESLKQHREAGESREVEETITKLIEWSSLFIIEYKLDVGELFTEIYEVTSSISGKK